MPLKRLKEKTTKENLWIYILALLKRKSMYAYEIRDEIKKHFDFDIGNVTAYMVLYKLNSRGYVQAKWEIKENRQRKYYMITDRGEQILAEGIKYLEDITNKIKGVI